MDQYRNRRRGKFIFFPIVGAALVLGLSEIVMLLWNAILPDLLRVQKINFWQSAGLLLLCKILFGGMPFRGKPGGGFRDHRGFGMREKWMKMTDEERAKFRDEWRGRRRDC